MCCFWPSFLLMPKSLIFARPNLDSTSMLSGFRSLWIWLCSCKWSNPCKICHKKDSYQPRLKINFHRTESTYIPCEAGDNVLLYEGSSLEVFRGATLLLNGDHCLKASTVHVLHHEMDLTLVEEDPMVVDQDWIDLIDLVKFVVELVSLLFL